MKNPKFSKLDSEREVIAYASGIMKSEKITYSNKVPNPRFIEINVNRKVSVIGSTFIK